MEIGTIVTSFEKRRTYLCIHVSSLDQINLINILCYFVPVPY